MEISNKIKIGMLILLVRILATVENLNFDLLNLCFDYF